MFDSCIKLAMIIRGLDHKHFVLSEDDPDKNKIDNDGRLPLPGG